jgi:predicted RecA/RadA family phage recombinase
MANNQNNQPVSFTLSVVCSAPATPAAGDPVRVGKMTGVALTAESAGGNASGYTSVDFSAQVVSVSVKDQVNSSGISAGDLLNYSDTDAQVSNRVSAEAVWGYALESVGKGLTATIKTWHASP